MKAILSGYCHGSLFFIRCWGAVEQEEERAVDRIIESASAVLVRTFRDKLGLSDCKGTVHQVQCLQRGGAYRPLGPNLPTVGKIKCGEYLIVDPPHPFLI